MITVSKCTSVLVVLRFYQDRNIKRRRAAEKEKTLIT